MATKKNDFIGFRISTEMKETLETLAQKEERTLSQFCCRIIKDYLSENNVVREDTTIQNDSFVCLSYLHFFIAVRSKNGYIFLLFRLQNYKNR